MTKIGFELLLECAKKPQIFEKSSAPFWDDEHISKGMLDAHLNPHRDAASRKNSFIDESVKWIIDVSQINKGQKILDLGCGPGLYAERLSKLDYKVTGIDFSKRSINYAKEQAIHNELVIDYYYQDYLTMDFENEFDLIIMIYCDFGVLSDEDRDLLLEKVYRALKPGGKFIFDVFTPQKYVGAKDYSMTWEISEGSGFWRANSHICLNAHYVYPEYETHLDQIIVLDESDNIEVYRIWDHTYTKESITKVINRFGFQLIEIYSNVKGEEYVESTETLGIVAEKQS